MRILGYEFISRKERARRQEETINRAKEQAIVDFQKNLGARNFAAATIGRLTNDFLQSYDEINNDLRSSLTTLRRRSRQLVKDSSTYRRYIAADLRSVIGPHGIRLQMQVQDTTGTSDDVANTIIEAGWNSWGRSPTISKTLTWHQVEMLARRTFLIDGECFIQVIKGDQDNKHRISLQFIDAERIDNNYNSTSSAGNAIINGIEIDSKGRRVAYYVKESANPQMPGKVQRIPAKQIIHLFEPEFIGQVRGFPNAVASMLNMHNLNEYTKAEVVAARLSACKMGVYKPMDSSADPFDVADGKSGDQLTQNFEPGKWETLPAGWDVKEVNPTHPNGNFKEFSAEMRRDIASGVDMSYSQLANDISGANYSSMRSEKLDEQDHWRTQQRNMIAILHRPVFSEWLPLFLLSEETTLPMAKISKFYADTWLPRSFPWVDPLRDVKAHVEMLNNNLEAPQMVIGNQGQDIEEVYRMIERAATLRKKFNIDIDEPNEQVQP